MNSNPIKVMIVDDEQLVRKGLMKTVKWEKFGMTVVADAANGEAGWNQFLQHRPEVVITDIVMPQLNGIELAKRIKEEAPDTKIMLLSCHSDFSYAQQAIKFGISGYILKTSFDDDEMEGYLNRIRAEIVAARSLQPKPEPAAASGLADRLAPLLFGWLESGGSPAEVTAFLQSLPSAWTWLRDHAEVRLLGSEGPAPAPWEELQSLLLRSFPEEGWLFVPRLDRTAFLFYKPGREGPLDNALVQIKLKHAKTKWLKGKPIRGSNEWLDSVEELYKLWEFEQNYNVSNRQNAEAVLQAVKYIDANLHSPLQVTDIAANVGLSRSHFSTVFKKVTGENVIQFIFDKRLQRAKQLLASTSWKVNEISEKIGIPDQKYFSKWFKKCTGQTPSEYRNLTKR